jgi:hypothetical protein
VGGGIKKNEGVEKRRGSLDFTVSNISFMRTSVGVSYHFYDSTMVIPLFHKKWHIKNRNFSQLLKHAFLRVSINFLYV